MKLPDTANEEIMKTRTYLKNKNLHSHTGTLYYIILAVQHYYGIGNTIESYNNILVVITTGIVI